MDGCLADSFIYYRNNPIIKPYNSKGQSPQPTIIVCDGDAANMMGSIVFAMEFVQRGYNVVSFDWRGFGESDSFPIDTNLLCHTEFLIDYNAVVDSIVKMKEVDSNNIGLYGGSTGAYLSFAIASINKNVKCFAGRALMTSFDEFLPLLFKDDPSKKNRVKKPDDYPIELYPINLAPHFTKPAFLLVGEKDTRTPPFMSKKIYEKLKGEKYIWIVDKAEHGGRKGPEFLNFNEFKKYIIGFYDRYLKN